MSFRSPDRVRRWHLVAIAALFAAAPLNMGGWIERDLIPIGDHAGYIAAIEQVWNQLVHYGRTPTWIPEQAGGVSNFTSHLKELTTLPLVRALGPTRGYFLALALWKALAGVALYAILTALFRSPATALVAGYAYGFGAIANHTSGALGHLDVLISCALFPLAFAVTVRCLRTRSRGAPLVLGILVSLQLHVSYVPGLVLALMIALLWLLQPWRRSSGARAAPAGAVGFRRQTRCLAQAFAVFAVLSASPLAWLAFDADQHALHEPARVEHGRENFVVQSPFQLVNSNNALDPWLRQHGPEALRASIDRSHVAQGLYLGGVALAAIAVAGCLLPRASSLRGWYAFFGIFFALQYWLAMGPHVLLGHLIETFHGPPSAEQWANPLLLALALACAASAGWLALRRGHTSAARRLSWAAAAAVVISTSAFDAAESVLPLLRGVRAPGHFFALAAFAFSAWLGVSLVVIERRLKRPALRRILVALVALLVVLDYAPSRAEHGGRPVVPLRQMADSFASLDTGQPPARVGMLLPSPTGNTHGSLVAALGGASTAWDWPRWQAGPHGYSYYTYVHRNLTSPVNDEVPPELRDVLARAGRIRYLLHERSDRQPISLSPPWHLVRSNERFNLWEQPEIFPPAFAARSYLLAWQTVNGMDLRLSERLLPRGVLVVSADDLQATGVRELLQEAPLLYSPESAIGDLEPALQRKRRASVARLRDGSVEGDPLVEVGYARPAPEHITLKVDAGDAGAVVWVSESYHPWWRARVDAEPAPVWRALGAFMAVRVGPGEHRVDLRLRRPPWVWSADWLSRCGWAAALIGLLSHAAAAVRSRRRSAGARASR
ncbi:MAG TPA: hypothetical protein VIY27_09805 [Myxococcota bacterium]